VRVVVQRELVLHGEDWCNHEYGPAFFRRPHDTLPQHHSQPAQHVSHWPSADSISHMLACYARKPYSSCLQGGPSRLALQYLMIVHCVICPSSRLPSASTSHLTAWSAQRASLSVSVSTFPFLCSVFSRIIVRACLV
jgi:hypothetical protein